MKALSLFDGISCGRIALERVGVPVEKYCAFEIDESAIQISKNNYPDIQHLGNVVKSDFTTFNNFDLLLGGSPCTYWSIARNNRETTPDGLGGKLFLEFVRALNESHCTYFLYENNNSIHQNIKDFISEKLGVYPITINSALVSAQNRKRCYWTNIPDIKQPKDKKIMLNDICDFTNMSRFRPVSKWVYSKWGDKQKIDKLPSVTNDKANTLTTSNTHSFQYYLNNNKTHYTNLTVNECEQLQTLPIDYTRGVPNTKRFKAIGNGWTVDVIAHILRGLK